MQNASVVMCRRTDAQSRDSKRNTMNFKNNEYSIRLCITGEVIQTISKNCNEH